MEENKTTQQEEKIIEDINLTKKEKLIGVLLVLMSIATVFIGIAFVITVIKGEVFTSICNAAWLFIAIQWWRTLKGLQYHVAGFIGTLEELERLKKSHSIQAKLIKNMEEMIALYKEKDAINEDVKRNLAAQLQAAQRNNEITS